jgi:hypothetical protein
VNTTGQVGGAIGLAVLATISTERTQGLLDDGESAASALLGGFHVAYLIGAALAAVAIAVAVTVLRAESPAGAMTGAHGHDGQGAPGLADAPTGPAYDTV